MKTTAQVSELFLPLFFAAVALHPKEGFWTIDRFPSVKTDRYL